jgi:hypothetical protein
LVISEIQLADNEFVELYNTTDQNINLSNYYFAYYSPTRDWNNPYRLKNFPGQAIIPSSGYYLIGLQGFPTTSPDLPSDWQPYATDQLSNSSGAVGIFSCSPDIATTSTTTQEQAVSQAQTCKVDAVGWGNAQVKETSSTQPAPVEQSLIRRQKQPNQYIDDNNNYTDFIIASSTPTNSLPRPIPPTPIPLPAITNLLAVPSPTRGAIDLFWTNNSATRYLIRYSQKPIAESPTSSDETGWQEALELDTGHLATTSPTGILSFQTPSDLNSQVTYYFAIKTINQNGATSSISNLALAKPHPVFQNNGDGTITNTLTGLMWSQDGSSALSFNGASTSQDEAQQVVNTLNAGAGFAGYNDWRLPNYIEIAQLIDFQKQSPTIQDRFSNVQSACYWTSNHTTYTIGGYPIEIIHKRWFADLSDGTIGTDQAPSCYLLPVRDTNQKCSQPPQPNPDGTITDLCLNIVWQGNDADLGYLDPVSGIKAGVPWSNAFNYAQGLPEESSKWRLPTVPELLSFSGGFPSHTNIYWTITQDKDDPANFWGVFIKNEPGMTRALPYNSDYYVRLVRDIKQ